MFTQKLPWAYLDIFLNSLNILNTWATATIQELNSVPVQLFNSWIGEFLCHSDIPTIQGTP
jgi:hypothetical protein